MTRAEFLKRLALATAGLTATGGAMRVIAEEIRRAESVHAIIPTPPAVQAPPADAPGTEAVFVNSGPGFGNRIAITFDDGPNPGITDKVLEELKKRDLRSTFFVIGKRVSENPTLAKKIVEEGHEIANHSYTHPALGKMSDEAVREEISKTQEIIEKTTGQRPVWFRPPYGSFRRSQGHLALQFGLGVALWSVDPRDWARPGEDKIVHIVSSSTQAGAIILLHDLHQQTANCCGRILDNLLEQDFQFTNISGFLGQPYAT
jgi:peptidoglycan/xylan/chitin deacetylase (PgdA/CDA1 family)